MPQKIFDGCGAFLIYCTFFDGKRRKPWRVQKISKIKIGMALSSLFKHALHTFVFVFGQ